MSEEEKQAVEKMQYVLDLINKNGEYTADVKDIKHIIVITNLIIKYQKEIEDLNKKIQRIYDTQRTIDISDISKNHISFN